MKPLEKGQSFCLGTLNERSVLKAIRNRHLVKRTIKVEQGPTEFGLVRRADKPWLATSVDGFMDLNIQGSIHLTDVEINTMSARNILAEA